MHIRGLIVLIPSLIVNPILWSVYLLPTILNLNSRSVVNKLDEIFHLLDFHCVDIAGVTETWLSDTVPPSITTIDGYSCERRDRVEKKGGGVLAYIRENIQYNRLGYLESNDVESLWVLVRDKSMPRQFSHILIVVVYVPLNACDYTTINHIVAGVDDTLRRHPHAGVMLIGDFNQLNDTHLRNYPLRQVVRRPTRARAVLDKIFTNFSTLYCEPVVLAPTSHSDHNTVLFEPASSFKFEKGKMVSFVTKDSKDSLRTPFPISTGHQYTSNHHASRSSNSFRTQWLISLDNTSLPKRLGAIPLISLGLLITSVI